MPNSAPPDGARGPGARKGTLLADEREIQQSHAAAADATAPWTGDRMLWVTSTINAQKTGHLAEKMTAVEMTSAELIHDPADMQKLKDLGFSVFQTDLDQLGTNEVQQGQWDWQVPDTHLAAVRPVGGEWALAVHFHVPPPWFAETHEFVSLRCLEHGEPFPGWSIWHPGAVRFQERGYRALQAKYGGQLYALWTGVNGDYGENEFPAGYRVYHEAEREEWHARFGDAHDHEGWWCGDECARADFRRRMKDTYGSLESLNRAWDTNFASPDEICYPPSAEQKRYWVDFVQWYLDSMTRFSTAVGKVAKAHLPASRLFWLLGSAGEDPRVGQDQSGLVKAAAAIGYEIRSSHGGHRPFAENYATMFKRIGSACKFYGVPFWSEPPYTISPGGTVGRFFEAVSCGAVAFYDWAWNPLAPAVAEKYERYGRYLTQAKPVVDVALLYPTAQHYLDLPSGPPAAGYPQRLAEGAARLRQVFDFDILDEPMIADGALDGYRVLIFLDGNTIERATLEAVADWVGRGGVAAAYDLGTVRTVEGDAGPWRSLFGIAGDFEPADEPVAVAPEHRQFLRRFCGQQPEPRTDRVCGGVADGATILATGSSGRAAAWAKAGRDGWAVMLACTFAGRDAYYELLRDVVYNLSAFDAGKSDALAVKDRWDGLYCTLFEGDKALLYNPTSEDKSVDVFGTTLHLQPESLGHVHVSAGAGVG